jgi:hypothetical protein
MAKKTEKKQMAEWFQYHFGNDWDLDNKMVNEYLLAKRDKDVLIAHGLSFRDLVYRRYDITASYMVEIAEVMDRCNAKLGIEYFNFSEEQKIADMAEDVTNMFSELFGYDAKMEFHPDKVVFVPVNEEKDDDELN